MADEHPLRHPEPLGKHHHRADFDCGESELNAFLHRYALQNQQNRSARTFVAARANCVVGYYTLAAGAVSRQEVPERVAKGLANHPVPIILLARLAIDRPEQGKGLGKALLKDALFRTAQAAEIIGCRALVVHAKNESAKAFYQKFGFVTSLFNEFHLFLLMKDLEASI